MDKAPDKAVAGVTPGWAKLRVVDVSTGETLERVREADAIASTVTRTKVDDDGNLVRKGDAFVTETVTLPIRIEWIAEAETPVDIADVPAFDVSTAPAPNSQPTANVPTQPVVG